MCFKKNTNNTNNTNVNDVWTRFGWNTKHFYNIYTTLYKCQYKCFVFAGILWGVYKYTNKWQKNNRPKDFQPYHATLHWATLLHTEMVRGILEDIVIQMNIICSYSISRFYSKSSRFMHAGNFCFYIIVRCILKTFNFHFNIGLQYTIYKIMNAFFMQIIISVIYIYMSVYSY